MNLNKIGWTFQAVGVLLAAETPVFAHGVDELPGLGRGTTVLLSALWIVMALGVIFFVRRLIRRGALKHKVNGKRPEKNTNEPK